MTTSPIAESLRPDDDIVVLVGDLSHRVAWDGGQPTPVEALRSALIADRATTAVVTVTGVSGVLSVGNIWISTKFVATVDEVLKTGKNVEKRDRVSRGQRIEFSQPGGEAAVNGVVVRYLDVVHYPIGRKYLVFLNQIQDENGWSLTASVPLLIEGERLSAVAPAKSELSGVTISDVRTAIRESR